MIATPNTVAELRAALAEMLLRLPEKDRQDLLREARQRLTQRRSTEGD